MPSVPWTAAPGGLRLRVHLTPKSAQDSLEGYGADAERRPVLRARVRAAPHDGKANAALIRLIAQSLDIAASSVTLVTGSAARTKVLFVAGDAEVLAQSLAAAAHGSLAAARRRA